MEKHFNFLQAIWRLLSISIINLDLMMSFRETIYLEKRRSVSNKYGLQPK